MALLAAAGLLCSACSPEPDREPVPDPVPTTTGDRPVASDVAATDGQLVIGAALAQTGVLSSAEGIVLAALQRAVDDANAARGVESMPIELRVIDTRSDLLIATGAVADLIDRGADVIVVGCDLDLASTAARRARRANRAVLSPCVADTSFGPATAGEMAFSLAPSLNVQANVLAERVVGVGSQRVVVLSELEPFESTTACVRVVDRIRELGPTVAASLELGSDADVAEVAQTVRDLGAVDAVVSCLGRDRVAPTLAAVRAGGTTAPVYAIGGAAIVWPGVPVDDVTFLTLAALGAPLPGVGASELTSAEALLGYATVQVLVRAVSGLPDTYGPTVAAALRSTTFDTAAGAVSFGEDQRAVGIGVVFMHTNGVDVTPAP